MCQPIGGAMTIPVIYYKNALVLIKNSLSRDISCDSIFVTITELSGEFALL